MKKCLNILISLSVMGLYFLNNNSAGAEDTALRLPAGEAAIRRLEAEINHEEKALRELRRRYENILKEKQKLQSFLSSGTEKEEQNEGAKERTCCQCLKKLLGAERRRAFNNELVKLKQKEIREKIIEDVLLRMRN